MDSIGRYIILFGVVLIIIGGLVLLAGRLNLPLGRLPGDFHFGNDKASVYMPCATSILLSILLTVFLNVIVRFINK